MTRRINYRAIGFRSLAIFVAVFLFTVLVNVSRRDEVLVEAASLAKFDAGQIISDYQMGRYNAMTEVEIQTFLTSKNSCSNKDEALYKSLSEKNPNIKWHFENGHFVCLSEELFGDGEVIGEGETAAHIIWQAAQDYKINSQVLLVLLQKETGLITDKIPNSSDYRKATGYGCPDNAPCSEKYYGFKNQVRKAAALFSEVLAGGWTNYPLGKNYIQYNPSASCGGSVVEIKNLATSALYRYTPYQPNEGALAAGYGTATCGAYGNRNFYLYFEDWFGGILDEAPEKANVEPKGATNKEEESVVLDGEYQIYSKARDGKVIDIAGGITKGMTIGKTLVFKRNSGTTSNQIFSIKLNKETGYYNIINPESGLYIDVEGGSNKNSTPLIVFKQNSACNQDWKIEKDKDGYVTFVSRCSEKVLDATSDGRLVIYESHGGDNQKWLLKSTTEIEEEARKKTTESLASLGISEDKSYQLKVNDEAIDVYGGVQKNMKMGDLVMYTARSENNANQVFKFKYVADEDAYIIYNASTGLRLDVEQSGVKDGSKVIAFQDNGGYCNQLWKVEKNTKGYIIKSSCSGKLLSKSDMIFGGSFRIAIYGENTKSNQTWTLSESK